MSPDVIAVNWSDDVGLGDAAKIRCRGKGQPLTLRLKWDDADTQFNSFGFSVIVVSVTIVPRPDFAIDARSSNSQSVRADWHIIRQSTESDLSGITECGGQIDR